MKPVWIVDDDRSIRWVFEKALSREGIAYNSFPDFTARARNIWGKAVKGKPVSRLIIDDRNDRL